MLNMISGAFKRQRKSFKESKVPRKTADSGVYATERIFLSEKYNSW
jgi:hypothetical protein